MYFSFTEHKTTVTPFIRTFDDTERGRSFRDSITSEEGTIITDGNIYLDFIVYENHLIAG